MDQETITHRHIDDIEIQEWLESLDSVLESSGTDVAREILERLCSGAMLISRCFYGGVSWLDLRKPMWLDSF